MRRLLLTAAASCLAGLATAPAARAAGGKVDDSVDGRVMEAANLVLPVVRDQRLTAYLFVTVRVELTPSGDIWRLKERSHFLRDALIRASHRSNLGDGATPVGVNQTEAVRVLTTAAEEALGPRTVRRLTVTQTGALQL